jgi:secondary thiamine-phosphate synthase enzyme
MDTFSLVRPAHHLRLRVDTSQPTEFVDITDRLRDAVAVSGVDTGLLNVMSAHTTTGVVVNEHEPRLLDDLHTLLARLAPRGVAYRHDDLARRPGITADEPRNGHAHCRALLLPTSVCLNVIDGGLALGRWQRVFLVELDGPRPRDVSAVVIGAAR